MLRTNQLVVLGNKRARETGINGELPWNAVLEELPGEIP